MARVRSASFDLNRESIKRAAARLFAQHGYPGTSMADLARECGVSKPLLYHYVDDKYQLLLEITEGHVSRLAALVAEVEALPLGPRERLHRLIERFVQEYAEARDDHGVLTQDVKFLSDADRARVLGIERRIVASFARVIVAVRPGLADSALERPLAMLLFGMMNWMFTWFHPDGPLSHGQIAPVVADLFVGGLEHVAVPGARAARAVDAVPEVRAAPAPAHASSIAPRRRARG